jgi:hypothetical protein
MDEWEWMVPYICGAKPVTLEWLWSQHCEHRMVLPRLIYLGLGHLTGFSFRAGAFYNVTLLSLLSALLMRTARRLRGRASWCDAAIPMALLHWGQFINLGWGFELNFITSVFLSGLLLPLLLERRTRLSLPAALAMTICLLALGLCGCYGLPFLPAMGVWIASAGVLRLRDAGPQARRQGLLLLLLAAMPMMLTGAIFYHLHRAFPASPGLWPSLRTAVEVWAASLGPAAQQTWPFSGLLILGIVAGTLWQAGRALAGCPRLRLLAWGAVCYLGALAVLGLGIGSGRAFVGEEVGFTDRYMSLTIPLLLICYLLWETWETRAAMRFQPHLRRASFALMCVLVVVDAHKGLHWAAENHSLDVALAGDMRCGLPPEAIAVRYLDETDFSDIPTFTQRLRWLQQAGLGPYRQSPAMLDVTIRPILGERYDRHACRSVCVSASQSYTQRFRFAAAGQLMRIDLELNHVARRNGLKSLRWSLAEVSASGAAAACVGGQVDLRRLGYDEFASLTVPSLPVDSRHTWLLTLSAPPGAAPQEKVELPMFPSMDASRKPIGTGLRAFFVLAHSTHAAEVLACRAPLDGMATGQILAR